MADIAIFRINYKSDFILTLNSDAGWMTPFCIKFWTGAPSQAYFAGYDGTTYTHCAPVEGDPTKLVVQFDDHHLPVGDLTFQIGYHFTVADFPTSIEDEVLNQASVIIEVDDAPAQVMLDLNGETAPEIEFSLPAYANEAQRIANEEQRIAHEAIRIVNEESRIAAETIRQQNEAQRISNEESRVTEFARLKQESETATADANAAATLANEKAALAADKAALAQAAATLANAKAQLAADKAALADAAATLANDKAALAQQKAAYAQAQGDYAQAQGDYAKAQGDYAKEQGDYAKEQGDTAQADHERAEADHTTAADDHTTAAADHTTAASDHTRAEGDHTTAASDHTRAEGDHTTAASDHTRAESDHTTAAADHETAASDHTRAESDHAAVEVYVDSLGAFDISSYHATGGELAKYADLTAALGNGAANIPEAIRKGGMSVKFVQSSDNKYVQARCMAQNFTTDVTQWQVVDDEPTAGSKNLVESNGIDAQKYTRIIEIEGTGDNTYHEKIVGSFIGGQKIYCRFNTWSHTSATSGVLLRIRKVVNDVNTIIADWSYNQTPPQTYEINAENGATYYIGGRCDSDSSIKGIFSYDCFDLEKYTAILESITALSDKITYNSDRFVYNSDVITIDNDTRTISFTGNLALVSSRGDAVTYATNNKSCSFTADVIGTFTGTSMALLVYNAQDELLHVKEYTKATDKYDVVLAGLKFDRALGSGSTASNQTKVKNYISVLPFVILPKDENPLLTNLIVEKRASQPGLGGNTFAPYTTLGTLTAGVTYYLYTNNYKHTSYQSGYLFAIRKNSTVIQSFTGLSPFPIEYTFVAEEGAVYSFAGRCDSDDEIVVELLTKEKDSIDVDEIKKVIKTNNFSPLVHSILDSVTFNSKIGGFFYITDLHSHFASLYEMIRIKSAYNINKPMLVGGDIVGGWPITEAGQEKIDEYMQVCEDAGIYHVVGQHEIGFAPSADPDAVIGRTKASCYSTEQTFNRYFAPLKTVWGLPNLDKCYYYKDFGNVRLIALYQYNRPEIDDPLDNTLWKYQRALLWYGTEQLQWFANTLNSMITGQVAVILCHQPTKQFAYSATSKFQDGHYASSPNNITTDDPITEIINAFNNKTQLVKTYTPTDTATYLVSDGFEESVNIDFSNAEGTAGFIVMGDNHYDAVGRVVGILSLCLTGSGECVDGVITENTGYESDYLINLLGVSSARVELGRVGQQYFCGKVRDIERINYNE